MKITLHAGVGDWEECSPETCTQTRQVLCETADARIVASDLCGEELPASERACVGADAAVCGEGAVAATAAAAAAADGSAADAHGREGGASPAEEAEAAEAAAVGGEGGDSKSSRTDSRKPRSSAEAPAPKGSAKASKMEKEKGGGAGEEREESKEEQRGGGAAHGSRKPSSWPKVSAVSCRPCSTRRVALKSPPAPRVVWTRVVWNLSQLPASVFAQRNLSR